MGHEATRIYKLQKKAIYIRTISKSKYNAHTEPIFKKLQFLKLNDIFKLQQLKFYYKHIKGDLPKYFQHFSYIHNQLVECRTRNRESPGSNPLCYRFEDWAFFVLFTDAPVHSAV